MLTNAFEATEDGGEVRLWTEEDAQSLTFCVWNSQPIPDDTARRVFQRNFTTKSGSGRGLGTFGMRLLGETYLRGQVSFTTSPSDGTVFCFRLPKEPSRANPPTA
jgi:signal transduction histidine kinase